MLLRKDIFYYGSASMPDDDTDLNIGGAIDTSTKVVLKDMPSADEVEAVSSSASDTTQTVTVTGRTATGAKVEDIITLTGQTPAQAGSPNTFGRIIKALKSASATGTVAVMNTTNAHSGTATAGGTDSDGNPYIDLDAGASGTDDIYKNMVLRMTSGDTQYEIDEIIKYDGTQKRAYLRDGLSVDPTGDDFEIAEGVIFDKSPSEILEVRRINYDEVAEAEGGSNKKSYDKFFIKNNSSTNALTNTVVKEVAGGAADKMAFGLDAAVDASTTNGAGNNRNVAPSGITFDSADKDIPGGNLDVGEAIGVWVEATLNAGDGAYNGFYEVEVQGSSTE